MKIILAIASIPLMVFLHYSEEAKQVKVWLEEGGLLSIEAEHFQPEIQNRSVPFTFQNDPQGYSGSGYLVWDGEGHWKGRVPYDSMPENRALVYHFKINTPGTYYAKIRNYHHLKDGDNDIYLSINKGNWNKIYDHQEKEFTWDENGKWDDAFPQYLKAGIYTLEIAGRSVGFGVDKIALFLEEHYPTPLDNHAVQPWFSNEESRTTITEIDK